IDRLFIRSNSMAVLEVLDRAFVLLCGAARGERPQVAALAGLGIHLPRIQPETSRWQFANHDQPSSRQFPAGRVSAQGVQKRVKGMASSRALWIGWPHPSQEP